MNWINVEDQLPEYFQIVLVWSKFYECEIQIYKHIDGNDLGFYRWTDIPHSGREWEFDGSVTHWMPRPNQPT